MTSFSSEEKLAMINSIINQPRDSDLDSYQLDKIQIILDINRILDQKESMEKALK